MLRNYQVAKFCPRRHKFRWNSHNIFDIVFIGERVRILSRVTVHDSLYRPCSGEQCELRGPRRTTRAWSPRRGEVKRRRKEKGKRRPSARDTTCISSGCRQFASGRSNREQFCQWLYILSSYCFVDFTSTTVALYIDKHTHDRSMFTFIECCVEKETKPELRRVIAPAFSAAPNEVYLDLFHRRDGQNSYYRWTISSNERKTNNLLRFVVRSMKITTGIIKWNCIFHVECLKSCSINGGSYSRSIGNKRYA